MTTDPAVEPSTRPPGRAWGRWLGTALSALALGVVLLVAAAAIIVPRVAGATTYTVLTGSMEPAYPPGTLIVVRPVPPREIQVGDVITFQLESGKPDVATHRVVEKGFRHDGEVQFITKGDANAVADQTPVREVQIRGRLWYAIPHLGRISVMLDGQGRAVVTAVVAGGLLLYGAWSIGSGLLGRRRPAEQPGGGPAGPTPAAGDGPQD